MAKQVTSILGQRVAHSFFDSDHNQRQYAEYRTAKERIDDNNYLKVLIVWGEDLLP
jgi:hypothetical protein